MQTKRILHLVAAILIVAMTSISCGSSDTVDVGGTDTPPDSGDSGSDAGSSGGTRPTLKGVWVLQTFELDGADVPLPDGAIDMTIEAGRIGGTGGCNSFGGQIDAADDGTLTITEMAWTEMACADNSRMDFESNYLPALAGATRWDAGPDGITFSSDSASMSYAPGEPPATLPLVDTTWTFDTVYSGSGVYRSASSTDMSRPEVTMVVSAGSATLTSDECGPLTVPLNVEDGVDGNLAVADEARADKPECEDPESNMTAVIEGLWEATGFMVDENRLTIIGLPGELIGFSGAN